LLFFSVIWDAVWLVHYSIIWGSEVFSNYWATPINIFVLIVSFLNFIVKVNFITYLKDLHLQSRT